MKKYFGIILYTFVIALLWIAPTFAATINYYVSVSGSDSNNGTSRGSAFRTIQHATDVALDDKRLSHDLIVNVGTGIYREGVNIVDNAIYSGNGSITFRGVSLGAVIIDGTDQYTGGWTLSGGIYEHSWAYDREYYPVETLVTCEGCGAEDLWPAAEINYRREMLFVNDTRYRQVVINSYPGANTTCAQEINSVRGGLGVFCVDETANKIYVKLATGHTITTTEITGERGSRTTTQTAPGYSKTWVINHIMRSFNVNNITVENFIFQRAGTLWNRGAVEIAHRGNTVRNNIFRQNAMRGFDGADMKNGFIRNNQFLDNGIKGAGGSYTNVVSEDNLVADNGFRSSRADYYTQRTQHGGSASTSGGLYSFTIAGWKVGGGGDSIRRRNRMVRNAGNGLWFDVHSSDNQLFDNYMCENQEESLFYEISEYLTGKNNFICKPRGNFAPHMRLIDNIFYSYVNYSLPYPITNTTRKSEHHFLGFNVTGGRDGLDMENTTITNNVFINTSGTTSRPIVFGNYEHDKFWNTLNSDYNFICNPNSFARFHTWYRNNLTSAPTTNQATWNGYGFDLNSTIVDSQSSCTTGRNLVSFYNNKAFTGIAKHYIANGIGTGRGTASPFTGINANQFSVRRRSKVTPTQTGTYTFSIDTDNAVRLWINSGLIINQWTTLSKSPISSGIVLNGGQSYSIVMEYAHETGNAYAYLTWSTGGAYSSLSTTLLSTLFDPSHGGGSNGSLFSGSMNITTGVADSIPNAFTFIDRTGLNTSTAYTSNILTITGINTGAVITIVGGQYRINGGSYTSNTGLITSGQTVQLQKTSSANGNQTTSATVTIGGVSDTWSLTTQNIIAFNGAYYVDTINGSDANNGFTLGTAFKTLQTAADLAITNKANNIATTIYVASGRYAESIEFDRGGSLETDNNTPIALIALDPGDVIIDGTDAHPSGWTLSGGVYSKSRNPSWQAVLPTTYIDTEDYGVVAEVLRHRAQVFHDNFLYRQVQFAGQVGTTTCAQEINRIGSAGGVYCYDDAANIMYVKLRGGDSSSNLRISGTRGSRNRSAGGITTRVNSLLDAENIKNITVSGFIFQGAATVPHFDGAVNFVSCSDIVFGNNIVRYNSHLGLKFNGKYAAGKDTAYYLGLFASGQYYDFPTRNVIVENSYFHDNGYNNIDGGELFNYISRNNRIEGAMLRNLWSHYYPPTGPGNNNPNSGGWYSWAVAGEKQAWLSSGLYENNVYSGNRSNGLWFDVQAQYITIKNSYICQNYNYNAFLEISRAFTLDNNFLCKIYISSSSGFTITNNVFHSIRNQEYTYNEPIHHIIVGSRAGGRVGGVPASTPGWENFAVYPEFVYLRNNTFIPNTETTDSRPFLQPSGDGDTIARFYDSLDTNRNVYCDEDTMLFSLPYSFNSQRTPSGRTGFNGWKGFGYDLNGLVFENQSSCTSSLLVADFYNNTGVSGTAITTLFTGGLAANRGAGAPINGINADNFSVRIRGGMSITNAGNYSFSVSTDEAIRVRVGTTLVIDKRDATSGSQTSASIYLSDSSIVPIVIEYAHINGNAFFNLRRSYEGGAYQTVALNQLSPLWNPTQSTSTYKNNTYSLSIQSSGSSSDSTPDAFSFTSVTNAVLNSGYTSNAITVTGINTGTSISIINGRYRINAGPFTSANGTVVQGDSVVVFLTSANSYSTLTSAVLTIGGVSSSFSVTTTGDSVDNIPNSFSFTTQTELQPSSQFVFSETITPTGYNTGITVSKISGPGSISLNGGSFNTAGGTIVPGQTVAVRIPTPSTFSTTSTIVISIGGVTGSFTVITKAQDITPDVFSFTPITNAALNSGYTSNAITVTGINTGTSISINRGYYRINTGTLTANAGIVNQGDNVVVFLTSANSYSTLTSALLTIGGVSSSFSITTLDTVDSTPDAFSFGSISAVQPNTTLTTGPIILTGFITGASLSITNGNYSFDNSGFVNTSTTVQPGTQVWVRQNTALGFNSSTTTTLTVGGINGSFVTTTRPRTLPTVNNLSYITTPTTVSAFTGTAYSGDTVRLFINEGVYATGTANASGLWAFSGMMLNTGQYNLYVLSRTPTSNILVGTSALVSITIGSGSLTGCIDNPEFSFLTEGATNVLCYETRRFRLFHPLNNTQLSGSNLQTGDNVRIRIRYVNFSNTILSGKTFRIFNIPIVTKDSLQPQESGSAFLFMKVFKPQSLSGIVE